MCLLRGQDEYRECEGTVSAACYVRLTFAELFPPVPVAHPEAESGPPRLGSLGEAAEPGRLGMLPRLSAPPRHVRWISATIVIFHLKRC